MDALQFYPTPGKVATKMLAKLPHNVLYTSHGRVLEPSAGEGHLVERLLSQHSYGTSRVHCIESDANRRATLIGKGYCVVDTDFLTFNGRTQYDAILMNPPFAKGAEHVLHALHLLYDGTLVALINAETIKNPYSKVRQRLAIELESTGAEIEFIQGGFVDSEHPTGVECALVTVIKKGDVTTDFFKDMKKREDVDVAEEPANNKLALRGQNIENLVISYNKAAQLRIEAILKDAEATYYENLVGSLLTKEVTSDSVTKSVKADTNEALDELQERAWSSILNSTDVTARVTEKVLENLYKDFKNIKRMEFTEPNVRTFILSLISGQGDMMASCIEEVFDSLTEHYKHNRAHVEGWKSNDYFKISKKVVIPYSCRVGWRDEGMAISYSGNKFCDLEKALDYLAGKTKKEIAKGVSVAGYVNGNNPQPGELFETTYFKVRMYLKGTTHIVFKDLKLLGKLNAEAAKKKGWLKEASGSGD